MYETYASYGFVAVTIASEDASYDPVDVDDLNDWVDYFGLTFPVLADPGGTTDPLYDPFARTRPTYVLLGPGVEIIRIGGEGVISDSDVEAVLPVSYP